MVVKVPPGKLTGKNIDLIIIRLEKGNDKASYLFLLANIPYDKNNVLNTKTNYK